MKKKSTIWFILALVVVLLVSWSALAQEKAQHFTKVGSINFTIKSVAAGVGYSWGDGFFIFQDKTYPIKVKGFSVVTAGISSTNVVGDVYNLTNPADIAGEYTTFKAGAAVGAGRPGSPLKMPKASPLSLWLNPKASNLI